MSITITGVPQAYTPVYNEQVIVATSTQTAQTNFRYRAEFIHSTLGTVATVEVFPDSSGRFVWDAKRIAENYVTSNPTLTDMTELSPCAASFLSYTVRISERYGSPIATHSSGVTGTVYGFNAALRWEEFAGYDYTDYAIVSGDVVNFLTNAPDLNIHSGEDAFLHFLVKYNMTARYARVRTYNSSGTLIQTVLIYNNYWNVTLYPEGHVMRIPAGWNLNSIDVGELSSGSLPILDTTVASYKVDIVASDGTTALTEVKTYTVVTECTPYTSYRVHFLNALGGFDSFTFNRRHNVNQKVEKRPFEPVYGEVSGGSWGYATTSPRKKDFYIETDKSIVLNSDWITEAQSIWLYELQTSPEVYVEIGGELFYAYVKESDYEEKVRMGDRIFNMNLTLELGKSVRQRW